MAKHKEKRLTESEIRAAFVLWLTDARLHPERFGGGAATDVDDCAERAKDALFGYHAKRKGQ